MPCLSLRHIVAENTRAKQARTARREVAKSLETTRLKLKITIFTSKFRSKVTYFLTKTAKKVKNLPKIIKAVPISQKTPKTTSKPAPKTKLATRADMINAESRLGSTLFGPIPAGHRREFFHDRSNVWIWYEDWTDEVGHHHQLTVRYEVRPDGVYKKVAAGKYFKLTGDELENFRHATHAYLDLVKTHLYNRVPNYA